MVDLHRHDEYSTFDGFGKAIELAKLAKELGHTSLSTTNHGNTNGLIQTYQACKEVGVKAILGVEGYFLPKWKEKTRGYHLILIAKNLEGYENLNRIQYEGEKQKYYNPIWDFRLLKKYNKGLICTTACVAGYLSQCILQDNYELAEKFLIKLKSIFKDDLYVEVQPYRISEKGVQEKVNVEAIKLADKLGIKCILTSDSHRGRKEDLPTYIKMHEIAGHNTLDIEKTYSERYMPTEKEIVDRFILMHSPSTNGGNKKVAVPGSLKRAKEFISNLEEIENKCELNYLDSLPLLLPKLQGERSSFAELLSKVKTGLKERGKYKPEYIKRCKEELEVIKYHGFEDYFLIVADYVNWAKSKGIVVGPGRGSVCNSIVAYALKITEVDSILFDLDFRRFLRKDKKKFPDIDLDFETSRRHEVIEYIIAKYPGHSARICSYGLYKVDNLVNDLAKVCGLDTTGDVDEGEKKYRKGIISEIKSLINRCIDESGELDEEKLFDEDLNFSYNDRYDGILTHFTKLFKKVRYIGTHAAGVAVTGGNILDYVALRIDKDGNLFTNYDLNDIEGINVIKFDILGLKTMESIGDLRKATGVTVNYDEIVSDEKIMQYFREGKCDGIFQLEKNTAKRILSDIECDCFMDIVAATSMNRPGPLMSKMPEMYAENKKHIEEAKRTRYWKYTKDSYGAIIYQEQLQQLCVYIGQMSWSDSDAMLKLCKHGKEQAISKLEKMKANGETGLDEKFISGAIKSGLSKEEAEQLFESMLVYSFVKGHGTGYSLISVEEMFYKVYYPNEYWFSKLKYARDDAEFNKFCEKAVSDGSVVFLPHVNYSKPKVTLRKVDGENAIQQGLTCLKGVGEKAAQFIYEERRKNGVFISYDDFYDRCKGRCVTSRVIDILKENGALEFNKKIYVKRVTKYNSALYMRGMQK